MTSPRPSAPSVTAPLILLVSLFTALTLARLALALAILIKPTIENRLGIFVYWEQSATLLAPLLLLLLATLARRGTTQITILAAAQTLTLLTLIIGEPLSLPPALETTLSWLTGALLALAVLLFALTEIVHLSRLLQQSPTPARRGAPTPAPPGLTLLDLWRVVLVQWLLVWIGAELFLRFRYSALDLLATADRRTILLTPPALGVLPNLLIVLTLHLWPRLNYAASRRARPRAWILALVLINLGSILLIRWGGAVAWVGFLGAGMFLLGMLLFLLGLPRTPPLVAASCFAFVAGGLSLVLPLVMPTAASDFMIASAAEWLFPAALMLWLVALGWRLRTAGATGPAFGGGALLALGLVGSPVVFFAVAWKGDLRLLSAAAVLQALGALLGGAVALRGILSSRRAAAAKR